MSRKSAWLIFEWLSFRFSFQTPDGYKRDEVGKPLPQGGFSQSGGWEYRTPDGRVLSVRFVADERGFLPVQGLSQKALPPQKVFLQPGPLLPPIAPAWSRVPPLMPQRFPRLVGLPAPIRFAAKPRQPKSFTPQRISFLSSLPSSGGHLRFQRSIAELRAEHLGWLFVDLR